MSRNISKPLLLVCPFHSVGYQGLRETHFYASLQHQIRHLNLVLHISSWLCKIVLSHHPLEAEKEKEVQTQSSLPISRQINFAMLPTNFYSCFEQKELSNIIKNSIKPTNKDKHNECEDFGDHHFFFSPLFVNQLKDINFRSTTSQYHQKKII